MLIRPGWLTYSGRFAHISGHTSSAGRAQDRESSPVKDLRSTNCATQPSVVFVDTIERNKRIFKIVSPSGSHTILVFFRTKRYGNIPTDLLNGGVECRGWAKIAILGQYLAIASMTARRANNNCDGPPCSLPHRPPRISESCLSQPTRTTTTKRREQNLRSGKSKAEVANNRRLRLTYCTIAGNY